MDKELTEVLVEIGEGLLRTNLWIRYSELPKELKEAYPEISGLNGFSLIRHLNSLGFLQCEDCGYWYRKSELTKQGKLLCTNCLLARW